MQYTSKELQLLSDCLLDSLTLKHKHLQHDPRLAFDIQPKIDQITKLLAKIDKQIVQGV